MFLRHIRRPNRELAYRLVAGGFNRISLFNNILSAPIVSLKGLGDHPHIAQVKALHIFKPQTPQFRINCVRAGQST